MGLDLGPLANVNFRTPPKPVRIVVILLPVLIILAIGVKIGLDKKKEMDGLKGEITKLEDEIAKAQRMADRLPELKAKYALMQKELCEIQKVVPAEYEVSSFLKQVNEIALKRQLSIISWKEKPGRPHSRGILQEMPVSLQIEGSFHKIGAFLADLTTFDRVVTINNIMLSSPAKKRGVVKLSASLEAVAYTTEKPAECGDDEEDGQ